MPYKMFQGMRQKTVQKLHKQKEEDKNLGILGDSSRSQKVMQKYFDEAQQRKQKDKEMRVNNMENRGVNLHAGTGAYYKDGALMIN